MLKVSDFAIPNPLPQIGDRRADKIHLAVGRALHSWEAMEFHLGHLFGSVLGTSFPTAALSAYASGSSFAGRKDMLMHAAEEMFHWRKNPDLHKNFKFVIERLCVEASSRRNEIAHGLVAFQTSADGPNGYFLVPSYHSLRKRLPTKEEKYRYTSKEIARFTANFKALARTVRDLQGSILDWHQSFAKTSLLPPARR